jgi:hypothetical protein
MEVYKWTTEIPYFKSRVVCAKCGARGNKIDVRPNWKEQPTGESLTGKVFRWARWRVDIIRKRAERLGTIEAATEKEAIEKAAKEFDIPLERQNRIAVEKLSKSKDYRTVPSPVAPAISGSEFRHESNCRSGCTLSDDTRAASQAALFYLDGTVIVASRRLL